MALSQVKLETNKSFERTFSTHTRGQPACACPHLPARSAQAGADRAFSRGAFVHG